jgi:O-antigen ligase
MDFFLLSLFAFLRPILFIKLDSKILGLNIFEFGALLFTVALIFAFLLRAVLTKRIYINGTDFLVLLLAFWCIAIFLIYHDKSDIRELAKFLIPLFTFIAAKNIIQNKKQYKQLLLLLIIGFMVPCGLSTGLILLGKGVQYISYWTTIPRYEGVYLGAHNLAHNMAFLLMAIVIYTFLPDTSEKEIAYRKKGIFLILASMALFCIYMSQVRTVITGLLTFFIIFLYTKNKKLLLLSGTFLIILGIILSPIIVPRFFNDFYKVYTGEWATDKIGSNRPRIWANNLEKYSELTIDRQIAGIGIGNNLDASENLDFDPDNVRNSHNDYLDVMMQTGVVGAILFLLIQFSIFKSILKLNNNERYLFVALFWAIFAMNFISNSYVARFGLAQMLYLVMAYVELPSHQNQNRQSRL